jgi:hypothetical protein
MVKFSNATAEIGRVAASAVSASMQFAGKVQRIARVHYIMAYEFV